MLINRYSIHIFIIFFSLYVHMEHMNTCSRNQYHIDLEFSIIIIIINTWAGATGAGDGRGRGCGCGRAGEV